MEKYYKMILSINGGSSSIKFVLFEASSLEQLFNREIKNIGIKKAKLNFNDTVDQRKNIAALEAPDHDQAANHLIDWPEKLMAGGGIILLGNIIKPCGRCSIDGSQYHR